MLHRAVFVMCVLACLNACASGGDRGDRVAPSESIGNSSAALGTPWDGDASTRSGPTDNTLMTFTAPIGKPGVVANADAGFCWVTAISGSFRGAGEKALISVNASGYYQAKIQSNTDYGGGTGAGPALAIRCRRLTDFVDVADAGTFTAADFGPSGWAGGAGNYQQGLVSANSGSIYPWAGLEGRLGDAGAATWMIAAVDHGAEGAFARWPSACPMTATDCYMLAGAWELSSPSHLWTYSVTGASSSNTGDTTLISATGQECYLDGVWGWWTATSEAKVIVEGDGNWHLVTTKGSAALGMGAYAACFPLNQGF